MPTTAPPTNTVTIPIKGMHCRSCELRVEKKLLQVQGVKKAQVSHRRQSAQVFLTYRVIPRAVHKAIHKAIVEAGYEIGRDTKAWISTNVSDYLDLLIALLVIVPGLLIFRELGLADLAPAGSGSPTSLLVVLVVGLTAGISTCMALVGGLVLGISARYAEQNPESAALPRLKPHLFFGLGRLISYTVLGGLIGMAGAAFQLSTPVLGWLTIVVGVVMAVLGLQLTALFPRLSTGGLTLPAGLSRLLGIQERGEEQYSHRNSFVMGALTFFLPCGFTQAMQLYAMATGNFVSGALIMGVFALGTAPGLLGIGGLTAIIRGAFARKFFKFAGVLVICLALLNISNGLNLTGFSLTGLSLGAIEASPLAEANSAAARPGAQPASSQGADIGNGPQVVNMKATGRGYTPNSFTVRKGIPVRWVITSDGSYSCANSLVSSRLGVRQLLARGENVITFTPTEVGRIPFSCSMGMYTGAFTVVENKGAGS